MREVGRSDAVRPLTAAVGGIPGSGKTMLARQLGDALPLPVVCRDAIKEGLHVTHRSVDTAEVHRFSDTAFDAFFESVALLVDAGVSLVIEAAFHREYAVESLASLASRSDLVAVWCSVPTDVARTRTAPGRNAVSVTLPMLTCSLLTPWTEASAIGRPTSRRSDRGRSSQWTHQDPRAVSLPVWSTRSSPRVRSSTRIGGHCRATIPHAPLANIGGPVPQGGRVTTMTVTPNVGSNRGWVLDELESAGRENLDADHVGRYDAKEDAGAAAEVAVLAALGLIDESVVVDLGAGTGQFSLAVATACARVVAVDVSPVMLARLQSKVDASQRSNVEIVQAGFLSYVHEGSAADFVYSRYALHHLPDFWKAMALARVHRILRPGGVLRLWDVIYNFDPADADDRVESWCATGGADVEGEWLRAELEEHVRDEYSTFSWLLEPMMLRCGFSIETAEYSPDGFSAKYIARAV